MIITEGEFDAMLLHQQASDICGVVTLGSASVRLTDTWLHELLPVPMLLAAYDTDVAGERGAAAWQALSKRVHIVRLPMGKDITEFVQLGGDVRAWVQFQLGGINCLAARPSPNSLPTPALGFSTFNSLAKATGNLDGSEARHNASVNAPSALPKAINSPLGGEQ